MPAINRSTSSPWGISKRSIPASSSLVIDSIPLVSFRSLHYILTGYSVANDLGRTQHYDILKQNASLKSIIHGRVGALKITISEAIVSGNMELTITNNELFDIVIQTARLKLGV